MSNIRDFTTLEFYPWVSFIREFKNIGTSNPIFFLFFMSPTQQAEYRLQQISTAARLQPFAQLCIWGVPGTVRVLLFYTAESKGVLFIARARNTINLCISVFYNRFYTWFFTHPWGKIVFLPIRGGVFFTHPWGKNWFFTHPWGIFYPSVGERLKSVNYLVVPDNLCIFANAFRW